VHGAATCVQRMQKALTQMNVQLANVISDVSGLTGQASIRAMVAGERDPRKWAELSDPRIHASREDVAKSLEGHWRPEMLFVLPQEVEMYDAYQQRIDECDQQLQRHLATFRSAVPPQLTEEAPKKTKPAKNAPQFELNHELQRIIGVDLTRIDGIDVMVAQTLISEVGLDMSRWKTEAHFSSWLGLCPDNRTSGDTVLAPRHPTRGQPRGYSVAYGCGHLAAQSHLPRSPIPTVTHQARCPESHYGDGPPARSTGLSNAEVRSSIH